ncbi:MAG: M16 family metallopeptidase [Bosea sp. (in: a-proteobacteria)]
MSHALNDPVRITRLASGLTIVSERLEHCATVSLGVWIAAGSRHEGEHEHGLSHLLEHMAFKGTKRRSAIALAEEIEAVGGDINAATSIEYTCYTARVLEDDLPLAVDILSDILVEPLFDAEELVREKQVILQEIAAVNDTPDDLVYDAFIAQAYPSQPMGRPILGTPETVNAFTADDLRRYLATHYVPSRMVVAAAGAVDHDRLVALSEAAFAPFAGRPEPIAAPVASYSGGETRLTEAHEQMHLVIGFPGSSFVGGQNYALQIFSGLLGGGISSRLFQEVREKRGLAYMIDAFHWPFSDTGLFGIGAACAPKQARELVEVTLDCMARAARDATQAELDRARMQMKVGLLASLESPGGVVDHLARQMLAHGKVTARAELAARLDAVTLDEVRRAGSALLSGPPTLALVGPKMRIKLPPLAELMPKATPAIIKGAA